MTKCSDVMTRNPVSARPDDTVASVARLMKENDIGPVPIVDDNNSKRLVGLSPTATWPLRLLPRAAIRSQRR